MPVEAPVIRMDFPQNSGREREGVGIMRILLVVCVTLWGDSGCGENPYAS
jgi:hypothetical protein